MITILIIATIVAVVIAVVVRRRVRIPHVQDAVSIGASIDQINDSASQDLEVSPADVPAEEQSQQSRRTSPTVSMLRRIKRPTSQRGISLGLPLIWIIVGLIALAAGPTIDYRWPPLKSLENQGLVPTPIPQSESQAKKPSESSKKQTARQRTAKRKAKRAEKRYQQRRKVALLKYQDQHQVPVWWLIFGVPTLIFVIVRYMQARRRAEDRELSQELRRGWWR